MRGPCRIGENAEHCIRLRLQRQSKKHSLQCEEHSFRFVSGPSRPVTHPQSLTRAHSCVVAHPNLAHVPKIACMPKTEKEGQVRPPRHPQGDFGDREITD